MSIKYDDDDGGTADGSLRTDELECGRLATDCMVLAVDMMTQPSWLYFVTIITRVGDCTVRLVRDRVVR